MHFTPNIGPLRKLACRTDREGRFRFENVPPGQHEFVAVTMDPMQYERHPHPVPAPGSFRPTFRGDRTWRPPMNDWESAPSRPFPLRIRKPFKTVKSPGRSVASGNCAIRSTTRSPANCWNCPCPMRRLPTGSASRTGRDAPFQITSDHQAALLTDLEAKGEKAIALYQAVGTPLPSRPLRDPIQFHRNGRHPLGKSTAGPVRFA